MHFLIESHYLLENYDPIWDKVSADIKKEFHSKPVYIKFFLKSEAINLMQNIDLTEKINLLIYKFIIT